MDEMVTECGRARQTIIDGLKQLGFVAHNTRANFIIWQVSEPKRAVQALAARNVYVSNKDAIPQMKGCLRVTVGNAAQSKQFLGIVQELRAKGLLEP
jgi:histidinol-phosphate/aromatic aminotransferase/cobyric acid decarboxylase-like protein